MPLIEAEIKDLMRRVMVRPDEEVDRRFNEKIASEGIPEDLAPDLPPGLKRNVFVLFEMMNINPIGYVVAGLWGKGEPGALNEQLLGELETAKKLRQCYSEFITYEDELRRLKSQGLL